ncbi:MAG: hypothetical protein ACLSHC_11270 [Bilophila wadsworthia]
MVKASGERSSLYREVVADISRTWGGLQQLSARITGPGPRACGAERVVPSREARTGWYAKQG